MAHLDFLSRNPVSSELAIELNKVPEVPSGDFKRLAISRTSFRLRD